MMDGRSKICFKTFAIRDDHAAETHHLFPMLPGDVCIVPRTTITTHWAGYLFRFAPQGSGKWGRLAPQMC